MARSPSLAHRTVLRAKALLLRPMAWPSTRRLARSACRRTRCVLGDAASSLRSGRVGKIAKGRDAVLGGSRHRGCRRQRHVARPSDDGSTQWSTRTMAVRHGIGKDTVARIWRKHDLKPWRIDPFKCRTIQLRGQVDRRRRAVSRSPGEGSGVLL